MRGFQVLWFVGALAVVPACKDKSSGGGTASGGAGGSLAGGNGGSAGSDGGTAGSEAGANAGGNGGSSAGAGGGSAGVGGTAGGGRGGSGAGGATSGGGTGAAGGTLGGAAGETSGDTSTLEVTPEAGGTLTLGGATVTIPPNAVAEPTMVTLEQIDPESVAELPSGYEAEGPMLALLPHGLSFSEPVTITLSHTSTAPPQNLAVLRLDDEADSSWEDVAGVSADSTGISFETQRFCVLLPAMPDGEVIHTDSDPKPIGHMLLAGDRLYYSLEYDHDDLTHRVHSIRTDGTSPAVVATFDEYNYKIDGLAANASTLFIATGVLSTVPLAGGSTTTFGPHRCGTFVGSNEGISHLLVDASRVFCATTEQDSPVLTAITLDGTPVATLDDVPYAELVDDGSNLLVAAFADVRSIPKTLSAEDVTVVIASDEFDELHTVQGIAADDTYVYALTAHATTPSSRLWRKPRGGGAIQPVTEAGILPGRARGLLLAGPRLYFTLDIPATNTVPGATLLARIDKTATNGVPSHSDDANVFDVVSDGTYVYYASGSQILRILR